jgi:integrase
MAKEHRRTRGSGGVRTKNGLTIYTLELPADPVTGKRRRREYSSRNPKLAKQKWLDARDKYIRTGIIKSPDTPYVHDWLDRWLDEYKAPHVKPRVLETYRSDIKLINASIGTIRIGDLTIHHITRMEKDITTHHSGKTALNAYRRLKNALADAVDADLIETNVCDRAAPPRVTANPTIILKEGQPGKLIESAKTKPAAVKRKRGQHAFPDTDDDRLMWRLMWRLAFETGMRQGERFALTPADLVTVDDTPTIHVRHELQRYRKGTDIPSWLHATQIGDTGIWMVPPKSERGQRLVPVSQTLWNDLTTWATSHNTPTNGLLFTRKGQPLTNPVERRRWINALNTAGLPYVTIRSARHYFATRLAIAGASEDARKSIMGHAEISTTAGYTHWTPKALAEITGAVAQDFDPGA